MKKTLNQKKLCSLRIVQCMLIVLFIFECYTALRMLVFNMALLNNESLNGTEIYFEKYASIQEQKAAFKEANIIASMLMPMRLAFYILTAVLFMLLQKKCQILTSRIHTEFRKKRIKHTKAA